MNDSSRRDGTGSSSSPRRRLRAHRPAVPHLVARGVRNAQFEEIVRDVHHIDDVLRLSLGDEAFDQRHLSPGPYVGTPALSTLTFRSEASCAENVSESSTPRPNTCESPTTSTSVVAGGRPIAPAKPQRVGVNGRRRVLAELEPHLSAGRELHPERGVGLVQIEVRETRRRRARERRTRRSPRVSPNRTLRAAESARMWGLMQSAPVACGGTRARC